MPETIILSDGVTTIDLNSGSASGITTQTFAPPRVQRQVSRVSGYPFVDGSRTTASALNTTSAPWLGYIRGPSVDNMEAQYQALVTLLERAVLWDKQRVGSPVRLAYKRSGATNTAYMIVTGVEIPEPASDPKQAATETSLLLRVQMTLTVEPIAHAATLEVAKVEPISSNPADDGATTVPVTGSMPAPLTISLHNTGTIDWTEIWIAHTVTSNIGVQNSVGIADAGAYGGTYQEYSISGFAHTPLNTISLAPTVTAPVRGIIRVKVLSGVASKLQLQLRLVTGSGASSSAIVAPWVPFTGVGSNWTLLDLGSVKLPSLFTKRVRQNASSVALVSVFARSSDGSPITFGIDYFQSLPYYSFVRLTGPVAQTESAQYEMVSRDTTFHWPTPISQEFVVVNSTDQLIGPLKRHGAIRPLPAGSAADFWCALHVAGGHSINAGGELTIKYLPCYALGLRGNA